MCIGLEEQQSKAFQENITFLLYAYPISCSLFLSNTTAQVAGDLSLHSIAPVNLPQSQPSFNKTAPFIRPLPSSGLERSFATLVEGVNTLMNSWTQDILYPTIRDENGRYSFTGMQETFAEIVAFQYALIVQSYKTQLTQNDATNSTSYVPQTVNLAGTQPQLFARVHVNLTQLVIGLLSTLILLFTMLASVKGHEEGWRGDRVVRDGGVLDMVCLMNGSSLPNIIAGEASQKAYESEREGEKLLRRKRAEKTFIA